MLTLINQIEAILNSRPLTPLSSNPTDSQPLTPAHLMIGGPISSLEEKSLLNIPYNRLTNWQKITQTVQSFWNRYHKEYLNTLQQRHKWKTTNDNLAIGEILYFYMKTIFLQINGQLVALLTSFQETMERSDQQKSER